MRRRDQGMKPRPLMGDIPGRGERKLHSPSCITCAWGCVIHRRINRLLVHAVSMDLKCRIVTRGAWLGVALLALAATRTWAATNVLVPAGASWKYLDDGSNQGTAWRAPNFNDSSWTSGFAQFGYG